MKRIVTVMLFLVMLSALLAGCAAPTEAALPPTGVPAPTVALPTDVPPTSAALTVTDDLGRELTLTSTPQRIVSLAPSNTEILFAVGAGGAVVGVTQYCDYPVEAQSITQIGGFSAKTISVETIVSLKPDLVLAYSASHGAVVEALEKTNIPVYVSYPESFEDLYANIQKIGALTGHQQQAVDLVSQMKTRTAAVMEKVSGVEDAARPTVFWEVFDEPLMTAGVNTFTAQMIAMAGGKNVFTDLTEDYPQINAEEVIKRNPQVILGPDTHADKLTPDVLATRPGWGEIAAVKSGRIYLIDGNIASRSGPRLVDALELIAAALYPDLFQ